MPPSGSGPYGAPPPGQHSNRTAIFAGVGILGAAVVVGGLFLMLGSDDDNDSDAELAGDTAEQTDDTTDETLAPEDQQQTPDTTAAEETAGAEGDGTGAMDDAAGTSGEGDAPAEPSSGYVSDDVPLGNGLVVTEYGFSSAPDGLEESQYDFSYGIVIENTGDTLQQNVSLNVNALDTDGDILATETHDVHFVDAGGTMAVSYEPADTYPAPVADLEFAFSGSDEGDSLSSGDVEVTNIITTEAADDYSSTDVNIEVENTLDYDLELATAAVILRNTDGDIIGGHTGTGVSSTIPAGSTGAGTTSVYMDFEGLDLDPDATRAWVSYSLQSSLD